jgi:Zn-dependent protease
MRLPGWMTHSRGSTLSWVTLAAAAALAVVVVLLGRRGYNFLKIIPMVIYVGILLYAIILHEIAHGAVAERIGDKTARRMGRLTLNPLPHIDPFGTIILPIILYFTVGFSFGYARPVPVNPLFFRRPWRGLRGFALTAAAGPATNMAQVILYVALYRVGSAFGWSLLMFVGHVGALINMYLALLNLIPVPPLDGSRILALFLPRDVAEQYLNAGRFGFIIIFGLVYVGAFRVLGWIVTGLLTPLLG